MASDQAEYVTKGHAFKRDTSYITTRITRDGRDGFPVEPGRYRLVVARACPWAHRSIIVRRLLGLEPVISMGICGPTHDPRSWTFDLDPGGVDPVLGIERLQQAYFARDPDYPKGITVPAMVDIPDRQGGHERLPADDPGLRDAVDRVPSAGRAGPLPEAAPCGDRRRRRADLPGREQRRVSMRVRRLAGVLRPRLRAAVRANRLVVTAACRTAIPGGGHHHRGRCPAVHHPGPLRRGLPRALQVQQDQAGRDAGAVGLRARPVPDARLRGHHRLPAHQAALLHRPVRHQPVADRADGSGSVELADPPRP